MSTISKGSAWRRKIVVLLEGAGCHVVVRGIGFAGDDLRVRLGDVDISMECKDHRRYDFASWVSQAQANAEGAVPVVFAHRNGKASAEDGYVVMTGAAFVTLLGALTRDVDDDVNVEVSGIDNAIVTEVSR